MSNFSFAHPVALLTLLPCRSAAGVALPSPPLARAGVDRADALAARARVPAHRSGRGSGGCRACAGLLALLLTAIALAGPRSSSAQRRDLSVEGIDIVVAFDLSTSMLAADFRPKDRITQAKEVLKEFINSRQNDRIGLVVFLPPRRTRSARSRSTTGCCKICSTRCAPG